MNLGDWLEVRSNNPEAQIRHDYSSGSDVTLEEVGKALKKMGRAKAVGPDNIHFEVWKC